MKRGRNGVSGDGIEAPTERDERGERGERCVRGGKKREERSFKEEQAGGENT